MKTPDWDHYFHSHYKPVEQTWGQKDLDKYRLWYTSWFSYFEKICHISFEKKSALELGCGIGAVCSLLHERQCDVTGSDIARSMIDAAIKVNPNIPFVVYDITKPFPLQKTFDYVLAFEVLEHIPELPKAMKNIYSLLKPGGLFIGSTPYPYQKNMIDPTHVHVHFPQFWKELFIKQKFSSVSTRPMSFFPFLWKVFQGINPVIPFYIPFTGCVSTTLILAKK